MSQALEANFDGLVGPTHQYAGLAVGNLASQTHAAQAADPRAAALQGLEKMRALAALGLAQGVLPPQERPHLPTLRRLGFRGREARILDQVRRTAPDLLAAVSSASSMWAANAATVSPSADSADGKVHFTPANLCAHLHRALEVQGTRRALRAVFADARHFVHHPPLPSTPGLGDEGAANHTRLCSDYGEPGLQLFTYGSEPSQQGPHRYPARQARAAGEAIARLHRLAPERTLHLAQHPAVIDQGVFHHDVIAVGNREVLLYHAEAHADPAALRSWICTHFRGSRRPVLLEISPARLSVREAVRSYLFNSQLVCPPAGGMRLIVAEECREQARVWALIGELVADPGNPLDGVDVFDLRQSMHNGGGPACLRLRVVLTAAERAAVNPQCWITPARHTELARWVRAHYRDRLTSADLGDPQLLDESRRALDELTRILGLGPIYDFQR